MSLDVESEAKAKECIRSALAHVAENPRPNERGRIYSHMLMMIAEAAGWPLHFTFPENAPGSTPDKP